MQNAVSVVVLRAAVHDTDARFGSKAVIKPPMIDVRTSINSGPRPGCRRPGFAITGVTTISTGMNTYSASACFFRAVSHEHISTSIRWTLCRRASISCGVSRVGAVDGSAAGFGFFDTVSAPPSARANAPCVGRPAAAEHR